MGLYSEVINQSPRLGEGFLRRTLQTKDLTSLLDTYWLSPDGCLYQVWSPWYDTGPAPPLRGRVRPYRKSGIVRFTANNNGTFLEALTYFKCGELSAVICSGPIFSCETLGGS
jgi:hypothetical protein